MELRLKIIKLLKINRMGFSTFEMIIVLLMTTVFFSTTLFMFNTLKYNHSQNDKIFWDLFKSNWEATVESSKVNHIDSVIYISNNHLIFENKAKKSEVTVPNNIVTPAEFIIQIKRNGYIAPKTYYWNIKNKNKKYVQKIQMGWGIYRLYEQ